MKNKTLDKLTTEELHAGKKALKGALFIAGALILLYLGYLLAKLLSGTWYGDTTFAVIVAVVMAVNFYLIGMRYNKLDQELKKRTSS